jgi:hypothetical protein
MFVAQFDPATLTRAHKEYCDNLVLGSSDEWKPLAYEERLLDSK